MSKVYRVRCESNWLRRETPVFAGRPLGDQVTPWVRPHQRPAGAPRPAPLADLAWQRPTPRRRCLWWFGSRRGSNNTSVRQVRRVLRLRWIGSRCGASSTVSGRRATSRTSGGSRLAEVQAARFRWFGSRRGSGIHQRPAGVPRPRTGALGGSDHAVGPSAPAPSRCATPLAEHRCLSVSSSREKMNEARRSVPRQAGHR